MNFLILSNGSGYGGSERSIELISAEIVKSHNLTVFVENKKHYTALSNISGVTLIRSSNGRSIKVILKELVRLLKIVNSFNVIIANTNKGGFLLAILKKLFLISKTTKCLIFIRDYQWDYQKFIIKSLSKDIFCIPSDAVRSHLLKASTEINKDVRIEIIPDMVSNNLLDYEINNDENDIPIILCASVIVRWKGIDLLLKAIKDIEIDFQLVVVGEATDEQYLKELYELKDKYKLNGKVIFKPFMPNLSDLFNKCSIVINSSISKYGGPETFGRTIIEAWSHSKPVIAFNCGGPKFLIEDGVNGFLVPEGDVKELSTKIETLLNSKKIRKQLGLNGFETVKEKYSVSRVVENIYELLN